MSRAYPYLLAVGIVAAMTWIGFDLEEGPLATRRLEEAVRRRLDGFLVAAASAFFFARLAFIGLHWSYFREQPAAMLQLWEGGLSGWAAGFGALAGLWAYAGWSRSAFWQLADSLAIPGTLVVFTSWLGCLVDGCAYGRSVEASWWSFRLPDLLGQLKPRVPTQSLGALASAGMILGLHRWRLGEQVSGTTALLALMGHSLVALLLTAYRADPVPYLGEFRSDQLGTAALFLVATLLLAVRSRRKQG